MKAKDANITQEFIREAMDYKDGILYWKERPLSHFPTTETRIRWNAKFAGKEAGWIGNRGYRKVSITIDGRRNALLAHRLIWLWNYGKFPSESVDHINQNKLDNRLENLRDVSQSVNQRNKPLRADNTSGFTGVKLNAASGKWEASCKINGKRNYLGVYKTAEEAGAIAQEFRARNGFSKNHGAPA